LRVELGAAEEVPRKVIARGCIVRESLLRLLMLEKVFKAPTHKTAVGDRMLSSLAGARRPLRRWVKWAASIRQRPRRGKAWKAS
jgi:hypothetical protein